MELLDIAQDYEAELQGKWVKLFNGRLEIKIARMFNPNYAKYWRALIEREGLKEKLRNGTLTEEENDRLLVETFANTIVLDWKDLKLDGQPFPYSKDNCIKLLSDKRFKTLLHKISEVALNEHNYKFSQDQADVDAVKKN